MGRRLCASDCAESEGGRIIIKDKQGGRVRMSSVFAGASAETVDGVTTAWVVCGSRALGRDL